MLIVEQVKDRLLLLLARRDPTRVLFRLQNTAQPADNSRRGVNTKTPGLINDFPRVTLAVHDDASAVYTGEDATIDAYEDDGDPTPTGGVDPDTGLPVTRTHDPEFPHAQDYVFEVVHEGENQPKNNRTDWNLIAALVRGGPRLADPQDPASGIEQVHSWSYASRRTLEWVGTDVRWVTRITVTVHLIVRRSEILSVPLPDATRKGEV